MEKEKIGDRIAALHRLVAPFGKVNINSYISTYSCLHHIPLTTNHNIYVNKCIYIGGGL